MAQQERLPVIVAEAHGVLRDVLWRALRRHFEVTVAASAAEIFEHLAGARARAIVITEPVTEMSTEELILALSRASPTPIVVIARAQAPGALASLIASGACAFLPPASGYRDLRMALALAASGNGALSDAAQTALVRDLQRYRACGQVTDREREVLRLTASGLSAAEIAHRLHVAEPTVKKHRRQACIKLGAMNSPAAVAIALRLGVIE